MTTAARTGIGRRSTPLPPLGEQAHLTAVLRLGDSVVPAISAADRHYVYPPETVHVTVSNLDAAGADLEIALERLSVLPLEAPGFAIDRLGCSPDTLFLRCVHDHRFDHLRESVEEAFELKRSPSLKSWLFGRLSFANVVRFDGPGEWQQIPSVRIQVRCTTLEIVRTDRYLSSSGTTVLARIPLPSVG